MKEEVRLLKKGYEGNDQEEYLASEVKRREDAEEKVDSGEKCAAKTAAVV